ncbi:fatty acid synthase alpha subunit Lsd1 [Blastocladiella emersonii ATCC 22665]|nr:fatty acid synthase alpha subunit Lsd1 [Blastocladiella emersonii ATCC 22665]
MIFSFALDYAIVAGWQAIVNPLFLGLIDSDLLKLFHLNNSFKVLVPGSLVDASDKIKTQAEVISMINTPTRKKITAKGTLARDGTVLVEVTSAFSVRGGFDNYLHTFDNVDEEPISLTVRRPQGLAVLGFKEYISSDAASRVHVAVGFTLVFRIKNHIEYQSSAAYVLNAVARGVFDETKREELVRSADLKGIPPTRRYAATLLANVNVLLRPSLRE